MLRNVLEKAISVDRSNNSWVWGWSRQLPEATRSSGWIFQCYFFPKIRIFRHILF